MSKATSLKSVDSWTQVLFLDPLSSPLARWVARARKIRVLHITGLALVTGLGAGVALWCGRSLAAAGLLYLSLLLDSMDGKVSRAVGEQLVLHPVLDQLGDQVSMLVLLGLVFVLDPHARFPILASLSLSHFSEVVYALRVSRTRLMTADGCAEEADLQARFAAYRGIMDQYASSAAVRILLRGIDRIHQLAFRFRTLPYPMGSDARFLLIAYLVFPNPILLWLMLACRVPELIMSLTLLFLVIKKDVNAHEEGSHSA